MGLGIPGTFRNCLKFRVPRLSPSSHLSQWIPAVTTSRAEIGRKPGAISPGGYTGIVLSDGPSSVYETRRRCRTSGCSSPTRRVAHTDSADAYTPFPKEPRRPVAWVRVVGDIEQNPLRARDADVEEVLRLFEVLFRSGLVE